MKQELHGNNGTKSIIIKMESILKVSEAYLNIRIGKKIECANLKIRQLKLHNKGK